EPLTHHEAMRLQAHELERTLGLLRSLDDAAWTAATDCPAWDIRAMYQHVLRDHRHPHIVFAVSSAWGRLHQPAGLWLGQACLLHAAQPVLRSVWRAIPTMHFLIR